eukprot:gene15761-18732_t
MFIFDWIEAFLNWLGFLKKEGSLVIVGLGNAGKTTLLQVLSKDLLKAHMPTQRPHSDVFIAGNITFKAWDLGGQQNLRTLWKDYIPGPSTIVVFMVDSADHDTIASWLIKRPFLIKLGAKIHVSALAAEEKLKLHVVISSKHGYKKSRLRSAASDADLFNLVMPKADTVGFKSKQGGISKQAIKWSKFTRLNNFYIWLFLAVVGLLASIILVSIDLAFKFGIFKWRDKFINATDHYIVQYLSFILWTSVLAVTSSVIIKRVCPAASGSGVPDLKSIFSGFWNADVVKPMVLVWKVIGLLLSYGSGLSIGKEGPYIHISAILANALLSLKPFKTIAPNETQRAQMLASCCALGVAATFGSPIGGVLFSIEVTGTYYLISNYWRAFFASTVGAVGIKILLSSPSNELISLI